MTLTAPDAPLAAHLIAVSRKGRCHNFHAVPWPGIVDSLTADFANQYAAILGDNLSKIDASWAGGSVDSFFTPHGPLAEAQRRAAKAFGADATFFGTTGTTTSNQIALASLRRPGAEVLVDCAAHQSLSFAAEEMTVSPTPHVDSTNASTSGAIYTDIDATVRLLHSRAVAGRPFDALVLAASGYDGRRLALEQVLPRVITASPKTALVIDEAWSAVHGFIPTLAPCTALSVCATLPRQAPVLVTQSAHKTMAALRQGSYLHVLGNEDDIRRVRQATYRIHTTSPSWPILASLDLARAHAEQHAATAFAHALSLRQTLEECLGSSPATAALLDPPHHGPFYEADPLVLCLKVGRGARMVRDWLFAHCHVLVTVAGDHLVARIHLGTTPEDIQALACGLTMLTAGEGPSHVIPLPDRCPLPDPALGSPASGFIIPYPPGVPLVRPGETWTSRHAQALAAERARGAEIHHVPPRAGQSGPLRPSAPDLYKTGADQ